jgi:Type II secretion system (T2SS), protein E, N-terminal domain
MRKQLGQMLIEAGAIDEAKLRAALADQRRWGRPLGRTLVELRLIREEDLVRVLGQQLGLPSVDLDRVTIPKAVTELVPGSLAFQHNLVPFAQPMKFLDVAMLDPTNLGVIDEIRIRTQLNIRAYLAGPKMIERALVKYYGASIGSVTAYEIAIEANTAVSRARPATEERESVAIDPQLPRDPVVRDPRDQLRDGLRPFPAQRSSPTVAPAAPAAAEPAPPSRASPRTLVPPAPAVTSQILPPGVSIGRDAEIDALQDRISRLEALVARDEDVLRKLLALLIEKGLATREEIVDRLG